MICERRVDPAAGFPSGRQYRDVNEEEKTFPSGEKFSFVF